MSPNYSFKTVHYHLMIQNIKMQEVKAKQRQNVGSPSCPAISTNSIEPSFVAEFLTTRNTFLYFYLAIERSKL